jgi:DNA-binding response OmpR family regulator/DNA-binding CsgD family transcriptional regulator
MKSILIIEDNKSLMDEMYEALIYEGFQVSKSDTGEKGIAHALQYQPDLILCDIMMPEMDGYEVLKKLRQHVKTKLTPFIFITSLAGREHFRAGMEQGADDYLTKPFTLIELKRAIKIRLEKYYNSQIGTEIKNIEKNINSRLNALKQLIAVQQTQIKEISEINTQLDKQIKTKDTELFEEILKAVETSNTLHLLRNQLEKEIACEDISQIQKSMLQDLLNKIDRISNKKDNWRIFMIKFNQTYPNFIANITQRFPSLTQLDLTLISAILFNLNSNQVASMLNISNDSVRKSRYRLKKKLNLSAEESLIKYIHGFQLTR